MKKSISTFLNVATCDSRLNNAVFPLEVDLALHSVQLCLEWDPHITRNRCITLDRIKKAN